MFSLIKPTNLLYFCFSLFSLQAMENSLTERYKNFETSNRKIITIPESIKNCIPRLKKTIPYESQAFAIPVQSHIFEGIISFTTALKTARDDTHRKEIINDPLLWTPLIKDANTRKEFFEATDYLQIQVMKKMCVSLFKKF